MGVGGGGGCEGADGDGGEGGSFELSLFFVSHSNRTTTFV